jgi:hypothetical protein
MRQARPASRFLRESFDFDKLLEHFGRSRQTDVIAETNFPKFQGAADIREVLLDGRQRHFLRSHERDDLPPVLRRHHVPVVPTLEDLVQDQAVDRQILESHRSPHV